MSIVASQSPLGINALGAMLQNTGFAINPIVTQYVGTSKDNTNYTPGKLITDTCLNKLTYAINAAYGLLFFVPTPPLSPTVYDKLLAIGATTIPCLGNSKPSSYNWTGPANTGYSTAGTTNTGQLATWNPYNTSNVNYGVTQWGFIRLPAFQAWNEFNWNGIPLAATPSYANFTASMQIASGYINSYNTTLYSVARSNNFLQGVYSNMSDLISADIAGVNLATNAFGQDLITSGRAINLQKIALFGLPSVLLQTIVINNCLTQSLSLALLSSGLTENEITRIMFGTATSITKEQEQKLYGSFLVIVGRDLEEILIPLNCKTRGLESLADLLNIKKLFPNSYTSMTVPVYNTTQGPTNSKTYYPIFDNQSVNGRLSSPTVKRQIGVINPIGAPITVPSANTAFQVPQPGFGSFLLGILPDDIAISTGAFSVSMQQINSIAGVDIEKFAQVVFSIETTKGLNLINGTDVPVDTTLANAAFAALAKGSGPSGSYTMSDFFGAMSGLPYYWQEIYNNVLDIQTEQLKTIYSNLYDLISSASDTNIDTQVEALIDQANAEIALILQKNQLKAANLNAVYNLVGSQLATEQEARYSSIAPVPSPTRDPRINPYPSTITNFVNSIAEMAQSTAPNMEAQTLEAIADLSIVGGQSIIGMMRQERNQTKLQLIGIPLDNNIPGEIDPKLAQILLANGTVSTGVKGVPVSGVNCNPEDPTTIFTSPSVLVNVNASNQLVAPNPYGYVDPNSQTFLATRSSTEIGQQSPISEILNAPLYGPCSLGPEDIGTGPALCSPGTGPILGSSIQLSSIINPFQTGVSLLDNKPEPLNCTPIVVVKTGARVATGTGDPVDDGQAQALGSLGGSPDTNLVPININTKYTSSTLTPTSFSVSEAIEEVILCNCDCWVD
jgi:hypothetical protein